MPLDDADKKGQPASNNAKKLSQAPDALQSDNSDYAKTNLLHIPSISLPKGGGALKSIDEKFQVNAANGTTSLNITIPLSKSRNDFGPALSLNYSSGGGNSPFGIGWNISLPSIRRRTDKKLPQYRDAYNSDIFQLTGVEDLVVKLGPDLQPDVFNTGPYQVKRFIPRIEGAFTLIEQIQSPAAGMYWKTTTKDNLITFYGISTAGRVADPKDPSRIFEWLPEICYDDKGNCYQYFYVPEDLVNVPNMLHEGNRLNGNQPIANTYLKKIAYGNIQPYTPTTDPYNPLIPTGTGYLFNLVLDYGDHDLATPTPTPSTTWGYRLDAFSNGKPGFDWRTYRLCRRFLMFHFFTPELDSNPVLVKSLDLTYQYYDFQPVADPYTLTFVEADFITSATETGWVGTQTTGYQQYSYPALQISYQLPVWNSTVETISAENRENIPEGLSSKYQFTDLYNEGIAGILSEQSQGWYYNHNLGGGVFTPASLIAPKPSFTGLNRDGLQLTSLTGDGRKFIVSTKRPNMGSFELTDDDQRWLPFKAFDRFPAVDLKDPNIKFIDVNGDGMPDVVLSEEQIFTWYPAAGVCGYDSPELAPKSFDEEKGPAIVFADPVESIFLADMTGDGLTDIVRIRNGEISVWHNQGYCCFGAKVNMLNAPEFDTIDAFNPAYLHLADINGTGATDILYLGQDKLRAWLNLSGNAWGEPFEAPAFPHTAKPNQLSVADFLGNGTACIIWSSPLAGDADEPIQYIDLMGGKKPYLMNGYTNGMGKQVTINYLSSTYYYLQDKLAGTPWVTKLCFPVQCVSSVTTQDAVSGTQYANSYTYHHGYYDHLEKEYRGFARVEQTDTDIFDTNAVADQAPVLTKTWYHTGVYFGMDRILHFLAQEYFQNPSFQEYLLPEPTLPVNLTADEAREAVRACKGMILRQEVYALDAATNPTLANYPYSASEHTNTITLLQPQDENLYAVFLPVESQQLAYHYERNPADPRIAHTLNTAYDQYGNIVDSYSIVYARQPVNPADPGGLPLPGGQSLPAAVTAVQQNTYIIYTHHGYTLPIITALTWRLPLACEVVTWQITGLTPAATWYTIDDLLHPTGSPVQTKLAHSRSLFLQDLATPLPLYTMDALGVLFQEYHLAFNASVTALTGKTTTALLQTGQYIESDTLIGDGLFPSSDATGEWWTPSGRIVYLDGAVPLPFTLPYQFLDAYGFPTTLTYEAYFLMPQSITDAMNNTTTALPMDYRFLAPQTVTDANGNATDYKYDGLGLLVAIALRGKGEGDTFDATFTSDLTPAQVAGFFSDPYTNGPALLQGATIRYIYDFVPGGPFSDGVVTRQIPAGQTPDPRVDTTSVPYQYSFEYTDGLGRLAMKKIPADPTTGVAAAGSCTGPNPPAHQWIGKGKTVYNNKGNPVMEYEPYFSPTPAYEEAPASGVTAVIHYDPVGRAIRTDFPDGSFSKTEFDAWVEIGYDQNDTVLDSAWYAAYSTSPDPEKVSAAAKAAAHYNTPRTGHLDPLGRNFYTVSWNIVGGSAVFYTTQTVLDLENNPLSVTDEMGNTVMQWDYDLLKRCIHQLSMDAGERWILHDCMNNAFTQWDQNGANAFVYSYSYDNLHRPLQSNIQINGTPYLFGYNVYGEGIWINGIVDTGNNLRGRLYRQFDGSGLLTHYTYDFKGNLVQSSRIFATAFQASDPLAPVVPWTGGASDLSLLETEEYMSLVAFDAINRPILQVRPFIPAIAGNLIPPPYTQTAVNSADVTIPGYGESGALTTVNLYYGGGTIATPFVLKICHNEKGQRLCIQYGNNTVTRYTYDPDTFRLIRLLTTANTGTTILQDINYYYDPVGNVTYSIDNAQTSMPYKNQQILCDADYTYDPVYRLTRATGREQIAQNTVDESLSNTDYRNYPYDAVNPLPAPTDPQAMRAYIQTYLYDAAGNMTTLKHTAGAGSYTRTFAYNNTVVGPGANNHLLSTTLGGSPAENYAYDGHGNMTNLVQLTAMSYDFKDEFVSCVQQVVKAGSGQTTYYNYDETGLRTRKVTLAAASAGATPAKVAERLYIGPYEIFRSYDTTGTVTLQRETLHVMDDKTRIAMVDNKTVDTTGSDPATLNAWYPRYQYGNHLGSAMFELDGTAEVISYEEYHPFGTTSYQATDGALDVPMKRYRYCGKERDEESGLYYHGARYYAPWLCRWTSSDPLGVRDGLNTYVYVKNNPVSSCDPTGMWEMPSWKTVAIVAAVVVVGVGVTVLTAGVGTAAVGAAVAGLELTGAAATTATAVGAVAVAAGSGAAGSVASTALSNKLTGQDASLKDAAISGAVAGVVTLGVGAALGAAAKGSATAVNATKTVATATRTAKAVAVATRAGKGLVTGAVAGGTYEATRQVVSGEHAKQGGFDTHKLGTAVALGGGLGAATEAVAGPALASAGNKAYQKGASFGRGVRSALAGGKAPVSAPPVEAAAAAEAAPAAAAKGNSEPAAPSLSEVIPKARKFFNLPPKPTEGKSTIVGVLVAGDKQMFIQSGQDGGPWGGTQRGGIPRGQGEAFTSGGPSQGNIATHVEGHAAAIMHQQGISEATLYVESDPCKICSNNLTTALPPGSTLTVISPGDGVTIFRSSQ